MKKASQCGITATAKEKAVFEGTAQAFNDWLYNKPITVTDCFEAAIAKAFTDWLNANKMEVMEILKENMK